MANLFLAVYASSHVYLERFVSFAAGRKEMGFQAQGFTDLSLLEDYLRKKRVDALLLVLDEGSKQAFQGNGALIDVMKRMDGEVIMMGKPHGCPEWEAFFREEGYEDRIRYINRYQSAMEILTYVRSCFPEEQKDRADGEETSLPWLAGMYSPVDKVCHPKAAATIMREKQKVLYINLEQFSGILSARDGEGAQEFPDREFFQSEWEDQSDRSRQGKGSHPNSEENRRAQEFTAACTISDVIYCYKQTPGKLQEVLKKNKRHKYGMDVLIAPEDLADLEELGEEEWPDFLRAVARAGDYHFIFLDMAVFEWKLIDMVLSYGELYVPALPYDPEKTFRSVLTRRGESEQSIREMQAAKMKAFRRYFTDRGLKEQLRKIREVRLDSD